MNPGELLEDDSYRDNVITVSEEDVSRLIERGGMPGIPPELSKPELDSEPTEEELEFLSRPPGLVGDFCAWINDSAKVPQPIFSIGGSLTMCGVLFGRKVRTECGLRTNVYCINVGGASSGKDNALTCLGKLSEKSIGINKLMGGSDFTSDAAIESQLSDEPSSLFMADEVNHIFGDAKKGSSCIVKTLPMLLKLYSAANNAYKGKKYADADKQRTLIQPCCCLFGTTTPSRFDECLDMGDLRGGLLSRFLVFRVDSKRPAKLDKPEAVVPSELLKVVDAWCERESMPATGGLLGQYVAHTSADNPPDASPQPVIIEITSEAHATFRALDKEMSANPPSSLESMYLRGEENAKKIALIVAAGCGRQGEDGTWQDGTIDASIADYACRLVRYLLGSFSTKTAPEIREVSDEDRRGKLMAALEEAGSNGVKKTGLRNILRNTHTKDRQEILDELKGRGLITETRTRIGQRGKLTVTYYLTEYINEPDDSVDTEAPESGTESELQNLIKTGGYDSSSIQEEAKK